MIFFYWNIPNGGIRQIEFMPFPEEVKEHLSLIKALSIIVKALSIFDRSLKT